MQEKKENGALRQKIFTVTGIVLCVLLVPILIMNCTMIIKGLVNSDEVPDFAGVLPLIIYTDSMRGEFEKGDLIICRTINAADVKEEDVISFFDPAGNGTSIVTHRVKGIITAEDGSISFITKGDANDTEDRVAVPAGNLVAKYIDICIPYAGHVALFMQSTLGLLICVLVPLAALVVYDVIRRKKYEDQQEDDKAQLLRELEELRKMKAAAAAAAEVEARSEEVGVEAEESDEANTEEELEARSEEVGVEAEKSDEANTAASDVQ